MPLKYEVLVSSVGDELAKGLNGPARPARSANESVMAKTPVASVYAMNMTVLTARIRARDSLIRRLLFHRRRTFLDCQCLR